MAANLIRVDTTGCNLDYIVYLSTTSGGYLTVKDSGINSSFFTSNANAIVISTTSGQTLFDGNTREYIRSPKGSLSFTLTHSRWRLLNTVPYTPLGDAVLSNVVTTDLSMFGSVSNYVDFIVPNTMNVFGGFESQPLPTVHGIPVITASDITSTVAGLGSLGYLSSPGTLESNLVSTVVGLGGYGYISMSQLTSTASGLGSIGYISQATLHSTLGGLGTYGYISTSSLVSSIRGLSMIYISSSSLPSTVNGLGTEGYISMPQFTSSIIGISSIYASNIYSTITYLGGSNENQAGFYTVTTTGSNGPFASPKSIARDSLGNIYVADASNHRIRKIDPSGVVTTVAGSTAGFADGVNGLLNSPNGISLSGSNIYVADTGNNRIRMVVPGVSTTTLLPATVTTLAGSTQGSANGQGIAAQFYQPFGVAVDSAGIIYVSDTGNNRIRKIDTSSNVTTLAGSTQGSADGQGSSAQFNLPTGVAVDSAGIIYVADQGNSLIRKIDINSNVTTLAGNTQGFADGQGTAAQFYNPTGIAVDSAGIVYVTDYENLRIRKIDRNSNVTTLAGGVSRGTIDGQGTAAQFNNPAGIAVNSAGIIYIVDQGSSLIRKIDRNSNVTTLAGSAYAHGFADGQGTAAQFNNPLGVAVDSAGIVYVADRINNRIRKIDISSNVTTLAGSGIVGCNNGQGTAAQFYWPSGITIDSAGIVYVAEQNNNRIRKIIQETITTTTAVITTVAGSNAGFADGANGQFNSPQGISLSGSNIYVADTGNNRIRLIMPGVSSTVSQVMVTTLAGSTSGFANGQGTSAQFNNPSGVAVDSAGIIYVADTNNNLIRKIDINSNVTTLAGSGAIGFANGQGTAAQFNRPIGITVDSAGIIYVVDFFNNRMRKIDINSNVTTLAGSTQGFANGQGSSAQFYQPSGITVDSAGIIYVADQLNNRIRKIDRNSNVTTLAGSSYGFADGQGTAAQFYNPSGVAVDSEGSVYVADQLNHRIRKIDTSSNVTTLAGSGVSGFANGQGTAAQFYNPSGVAVDSEGSVYVADMYNNRIRKIDRNSNVTTLAGSIQGFSNAQGTAARFNTPYRVAVDSAGIIYVADYGSDQIRKIIQESITTTTAVITTVAGSTAGFADGANGQFNSPQGISLSGSNIYVADTGNNRIRLIAPGTSSTVSQAMVTTLAGSTQGSANGLGINAQFYTPNGLAFDSAGIIYLADTYNNRIRKISSSNVITLAGSTQGFVDSQGISAQFYQPTAVILDSSGNVFVADTGNNRIRKIDTGCNVTTVAGSTAGFADGVNGLLNSPKGISLSGSNIYVSDTGNNRIRLVVPGASSTTLLPATVTTLAGSTQGSANGQGTAAQFDIPYGVAVDSAGNVYVGDTGNHRIRKIDTSSNVTTLAGSTLGYNDGQGTSAQFYNPTGVAVDSEGSVYVADYANHRIRKIDRNSNVTTLAGSTQGGFSNGLGTAAQFNQPTGVAVDSAGIVYVADRFNNKIRKIDINSNVTTLAGSTQGFADGQGTAAQFNNPAGLAVDSAGIIYVVDQENHRIRKIDTSSNVTTLAGSGVVGSNNGPAASAQFYFPYGVAVDSAGNVYVADIGNNRIRKIDINSNVTTLAGSTQGFSNGLGTAAQFNSPTGVAVNSAGIIYVVDTGNRRIRKITTESITTTTSVITTVAGSNAGFADGANGQFNSPQGISLSGSNIYVADTGNNRIRMVVPGVSTTSFLPPTVTTLAGSGVVGCNNGPAASAQFNFPYGVAVNSAGIIYVADLFNNLIRKIDISSNVTTLAGSTQGFSNGPGSNAQFYFPYGIAVDLAGSVYVADTVNNRIRKIDINSNVTTLAGSTQGAVNGQGSNAQFNQPFGVAVDSAGFVYVADAGNNRIRKIDINSNVTTLAGSTLGFSNAQGTAALFNFPRGVAVDSAGSVYVADIGNNRIRKIDSSSNVTTLAGSTSGFSNAQGTAARFNSPSGVAVDTSGSVYVADQNNNRIRKITTESITVPTSLVTTVAGSNAGFADGGNGQFNSPQGISLSGSNIYVADTGNNRIRLIMPGTSSTVSQAMVTTFAGSTSGFSNAQGSNALFTRPSGVALDSAGIIYVADVINNRIRKIDINSNVTTLAGSTQGFADGQGTAAQFNNPAGLAVDSAGIIYVADTGNYRIRKIDINSNVTTLAGSTQGFANGQGTSAQFSIITGVAVDSAGSVYVVDSENHRIRKIDKSSNVTTLAGSTNGFANGPGTSAQFNFPFGVAVSAGSVYVADFGNNLIRKIDNNSNVTTVAGSNLGCNDGQGINAQFYNPQGITIDSAGFIYVCDSLNHRIRKIDVNSNVTTLAGSTQGAVNGQGSNARFNQPYGVAVDSAGIIYVADDLNNQIRKITTESITTTTSVITTVAGSTAGFANGTPSNALFSSPGGILSDGSNIYVADTGNNKIRKIANEDVATVTSVITTVAGSTAGFADGANAQFNSPQGISLDGSTIYVADAGNNRIRKIVGGTVTTISGCNAGFSNGPASNALFSSPGGIIVDGSTIYVADTSNNLIRKLAFTEGCNSFAVGYVSSATLSYTVANLTNYTSKEGLQSTTTSLSAMDSSNLLSTVQGLGQYYISTATLTSSISGVQASSASNQAAGYISSLDLNSSIAGLGTLGYISISHYISSFSNLISTGPIGYASTLDGIGSLGFISTATLVSTVEGLGSLGYISSSSLLVSTVQGLGQTYISTASLVSTMSNYISTMSNYPTSSNQSLLDVGPIVSTNTGIGRIFIDEESTVGSLPIGAINAVNLFSGTACTGYTPSVIVTSITLSLDQNDFITAITADVSGNVYYVMFNLYNNINKIIKVSPNGNLITLAGATRGFADGPGASAQFNMPYGVAVDSSGIVYISDSENHRIRKIDTSCNVTTLAGSTRGFADGQGSSAQFYLPAGITVDAAGIVYVADAFNVRIRKIDINSNVTTLAGTGTGAGGGGYLEGPGSNAKFSFPRGVAVDTSGNVYVTDSVNAGSFNTTTAFKIRKIDTDSNVTTFAGRGDDGFLNAQGSSALFSDMGGIVIDSNANLYVSDVGNKQIRKIDTYSNVTTYQDNLSNIRAIGIDKTGKLFIALGQGTFSGRTSVITLTSNIVGVVPILSNDSYVYYANTQNISIASLTNYSNAILFSNTSTYRGITNDSINIYATCGNSILAYSILTLSNTIIANTTNTASFVNGTNAATVTFSSPSGIAIDSVRSNLYVCDTGNNSIRKVQLNPLSVTTIATITSPLGIVIDSYSTYAYVTDTAGNITRVSLLQRNFTTLIASNLGTMYSIVLDPTNTYAYVTRYTANLLTAVNLITGQIKSTGSGILAVTNGTGSGASFSQPFGIVYTVGNFLYISDSGGIRETTTQFYLSTSTALSSRATAATIAPTTTLTNQVTGQCVYMSNTSVTTTPFISLTPTTVNLTVNLYANSVTAATFTASSGTSASGLGYFFGDGTNVTTISDIRTKENIEPIEHALSTVRSLQAVEYTKIDDPSRRWLGYIAQDVEDSIPEIVTRSGEEEWRSIQYTNLPGLIIEAIKELKRKYERILGLVKPG